METLRLIGPARPTTTSQLATYLAWRFPAPATRLEMADALWPNVDLVVVVNRLRVALSRLRKSIPVVERDDRMGLDPGSLTTDVGEVRAALAQAADEPDPGSELRILAGVHSALGQQVLVGEIEPWARMAQAEWALDAGNALIRMARLAVELGDLDLAESATAAALGHLGHDEECWELRLTVLSKLGYIDEGLRGFARARRDLREEGSDFSQDLIAFAEDVRAGLAKVDGGYPLGRTEADLLSRFFSRAMESEPKTALALLASSSFRPEVFRRPLVARRLLADVLARCPEASHERERCHVRLIGALVALEEHGEAVAVCERFLASDVAASRRRIALLNVSFSHFVLGNWDRALTAADEAAEIADSTGWPYDAWQCRCQLAAYRAVLGEARAAIEILDQGLSYFAAHPIAGGEQDVAMIQTNLGQALLLDGRVEDALSVLRAGDSQARNGGFASVEALSAPLLGRALAAVGESRAACDALIRGLRVAYREGSRRMLAKSLAETARALESMASPSADSVGRDWARVFKSLGHRPTPLDEELLSRHAKSRPIESDAEVLETVRRAIAAVRSVARDDHRRRIRSREA